MQEGDFSPNKSGIYMLIHAEEIDGFDQDQFGNTWYDAQFSGDAGQFMWLAKEKPEDGKTYYGHLEPTKSGKRLRFKRDKEPETTVATGSSTSGNSYQSKDNTAITASMAVKLSFDGWCRVSGSYPDADNEWATIEAGAKKLYRMVELVKSAPEALSGPTRQLTEEDVERVFNTPPVDENGNV